MAAIGRFQEPAPRKDSLSHSALETDMKGVDFCWLKLIIIRKVQVVSRELYFDSGNNVCFLDTPLR